MSLDSVVVALGHEPHAVPPVTHVRGTLLAGSLRALNESHKKERYDEVLDPDYRHAILNLVVASWVPVDVAVAHYRAMDAVGYTPEQQVDNGRLVAQRIQNTYVGTIIRGLKASGTVSVWALLERFPIAWGRLMEGGASAVYRLGPKEARVECHGVPFANIAYFRAGWEGMFESTIELVTRKVYTRQLPNLQTSSVIAYRISWV